MNGCAYFLSGLAKTVQNERDHDRLRQADLPRPHSFVYFFHTNSEARMTSPFWDPTDEWNAKSDSIPKNPSPLEKEKRDPSPIKDARNGGTKSYLDEFWEQFRRMQKMEEQPSKSSNSGGRGTIRKPFPITM
jgi:hypothetical protein